jgi:hypothetical protein
MSDPNAPICSIEPIIKPDQPDPSKFPPIPQATDLASALRAINALSQIVRNLTGQTGVTVVNNRFVTNITGQGGTTIPPKPNKPPPVGRWIQKTITRKDVKITNPDDPSQFVIVSRVQNLTMKDSVTGETWVYQGQDG